MKFFILSLIVSLNTLAVTVSVTNLCEDSYFIKKEINKAELLTVSDFTIYTFDTFSVPYIGNERSINSILNTRTGLDGYEVISDNEMKVYGWCFQVDGVQPDRFMSEIQVDPASTSHINWFYGYAHFLNGEWITYCTPSHIERSPFICKD